MPSDVRFAEIRRLLLEHGWTLHRISGSHHVFVKAGERPIAIPVHGGRAKHVYLREVSKRLGLSGPGGSTAR